jgi:hypothetical protein
MENYQLIKTNIGQRNFDLFSNFAPVTYKDVTKRLRSGNDPVSRHLEGCYILRKDKIIVGRFAFYENPELKFEGEPAATIGSYECINDDEVSSVLIGHAKRIATEKGYSRLLGPMEGSTWNNYRFSHHNDFENFLMEPYHHTYYNKQFLKSGFESIADYFSNLSTKLQPNKKELKKQQQYLEEQGCTLRKLDMNDLENELNKLGQLSIEGFSDNFLYTPIELSEFTAKYIKMKDYFNPELIQIIEDRNKEIQAFVFGIQDFYCKKGNRMIIKSLVKKKDSKIKGMGGYLTSKVTNTALEIGFDEVVHALMIKNNQSLKISKNHDGDAYKSYSLYGMIL